MSTSDLSLCCKFFKNVKKLSNGQQLIFPGHCCPVSGTNCHVTSAPTLQVFCSHLKLIFSAVPFPTFCIAGEVTRGITRHTAYQPTLLLHSRCQLSRNS